MKSTKPQLLGAVWLLAFLAVTNSSRALTIAWTNNMLTVAGPSIPGGSVQIWYLEAFCRTGSTHQSWDKTTIPHRTELLQASADGTELRLKTVVEPAVEIFHQLKAGDDEVDFQLQLTNRGPQAVNVDWFQPCMRVGKFTGLGQNEYHRRCFIFTPEGMKMLDQLPRTEEAIYRGGQVYVPAGINTNDVNPRPISSVQPVNGLIGCVSADDKQLLAMAWDKTQELFQGVIVCIHNDPRVGGLAAGEAKRLRGKVYVLKNDPAALLARYQRDFGQVRADGSADWPRWRGPLGTGVAPGASELTKLSDQLPVIWRKPIGLGLASPVVSGGKVFYTDNQDGKETVHALDANSGQELWHASGDAVFKDAQGPVGPRATPTVDSDRIYVQSCRGELRCLLVGDGQLLWRTDYKEKFGSIFIGEKGPASGASRHGYNGAPIIMGDRVIALAGSTNGAGVVALRKTDGEVIWKSTDEPAAYAPPVVATVAGREQIICFMQEALIGVDLAGGELLWRHPLKTSLGRHVTTPVVLDDFIFVASHEVGLVAVRVLHQGSEFRPKQVWLNKEAAFNFSSPVLVGEYLYGLGPRKNLICVEAKTGQVRWSEEGYLRSDPTKAYASFLVVGQNILVLTDGGELLLVGADPSKFQLRGRAQVCGQNWCNPAYSQGRVYLRDQRQLLCVQLE